MPNQAIATHDISTQLTDLIDATQIIPKVLRLAGQIDDGDGLSAAECDQLSVITECLTQELNARYLGLFDASLN